LVRPQRYWNGVPTHVLDLHCYRAGHEDYC
jgi:hypothetical protein